MPTARSWRDIPQQVNRRAMSGEGQRRAVNGVLKTAGFVGVLAAVAWGVVQVASSLQNNDAKKMPDVVQSAPVKDLILATDGVLDQPWLARTLALPKSTPLMALDLLQLRARLLGSGQVLTATLTRSFPATLSVAISERLPVARLQVQDKEGEPRTLLVARDGVVFEGVGFEAKMIETLPWLAGLKLTRQNGAFLPIAGMESVADLLAKAKLEAEHLYATWRVVSLARLESDGEIEVGTRDTTKIIFGTNEDFFRQLANLDAILDAAHAQPDKVLREINLSVGLQVPVAFEGDAPAKTVRPAPAAKSFVFPALFNR